MFASEIVDLWCGIFSSHPAPYSSSFKASIVYSTLVGSACQEHISIFNSPSLLQVVEHPNRPWQIQIANTASQSLPGLLWAQAASVKVQK